MNDPGAGSGPAGAGKPRTGNAGAVSPAARTAAARSILRGIAAGGGGIWFYPLGLAALMLAGWEVLVWALEIPHYILPAPSEVATVLVEKRAVFAYHAAVTLLEVLLGALLGIGVGFLLGLALFFSPVLEKAFYPLLITSQNVPVFAIAPLLVVWFGYGLFSKVVMAAVIVFFPITLATLNGLKRTDPDWLRLFRTLGATRAQILFKLRLPAALPALLAGLKLSAVYSTIGAVIGEWVGAGAGLGYLMLSANAQLRVAMVFGAILCLTPIGLLLLGAVTWLERRLMPWQHLSRENGWDDVPAPPSTLSPS